MTPAPKLQGSFARALAGSPLRRPVYGCLFLIVLHILLAIAFLGHYSIWISEAVPAILVFLVTSAIAMVVSIPVLLLLWYLDRRERESIWLFIGAIVWGGVISTGVSAIFNALGSGFIEVGLEIAGGIDKDILSQLLTAALVAPFVEETAKGLAVLVLLLFMRAEFDNLRDGLIYGALVGLGFNIAEVALYVMKGYIDTGIPPFGEQFAARFVFLGINGHLLWSALCGAGIGIARQTANGCLRWFAPIGGYAAAVLGHMLNNSVGVFILAILLMVLGFDISADANVPAWAMWFSAAVMNVLVQGLSYVLFGVLFYLSAIWERAIIRTYLADEIGTSVTSAEYDEIVRDRLFFGNKRLDRTGGRTAQAIINAQNELAFRKWHLAREGGDASNDALVAAWRNDIAALREVA